MEKNKEEDHHHQQQQQQQKDTNSIKNIEINNKRDQQQKQQISPPSSSPSSSSHMANLVNHHHHHHHHHELENNMMNISSIFDTPIIPSSPFAYSYFEDPSSNNSNPNSFIDLLRQDHNHYNNQFGSSSSFTLPNNNELFLTDLPLSQPSTTTTTKGESSEVVNTTPTSPNSTSISSSSNEILAANDNNNNNTNKEISVKDQEEGDQHKQKGTKPQLKAKKKNQKKAKEDRFAFLTKSDIDNLEDGYRWRKYGQKAVKNSPYPRSYYRCTTIACGVKKRVERSYEDPSIVMTTYEGQHSHPFPMTPRGHIGMLTSPILDHGAFTNTSSSSFSIPQPRYLNMPHHHHHEQPYHNNTYDNNNSLGMMMVNTNTSSDGNFVIPSSLHGFGYHDVSQASPSPSIRDHGLLQDILPSHINIQNVEEENKK